MSVNLCTIFPLPQSAVYVTSIFELCKSVTCIYIHKYTNIYIYIYKYTKIKKNSHVMYDFDFPDCCLYVISVLIGKLEFTHTQII